MLRLIYLVIAVLSVLMFVDAAFLVALGPPTGWVTIVAEMVAFPSLVTNIFVARKLRRGIRMIEAEL
jgi:hypothetical protein